MIDNGRWEQSWRTAGSFFRAKVTAAQWAAMGQPIRAPLGAVKTRVLQSTSRIASLPGVPDGDYAILVFQTDFAQRIKSIETVTLVREGGAWKVVGYFIR